MVLIHLTLKNSILQHGRNATKALLIVSSFKMFVRMLVIENYKLVISYTAPSWIPYWFGCTLFIFNVDQ